MKKDDSSAVEEPRQGCENLEEIEEGGFFCIHCGHINPKTATYCLKCGEMPVCDAECDGSSSLWHPKDW